MLKVLLSLLVLGSVKVILLSGSRTVMHISTPIFQDIMRCCWGLNQSGSIFTRRLDISNLGDCQESEDENLEVIDLIERRKSDVFLLQCARRIFPQVEGIIPVPGYSSLLVSRDGGLIAYAWMNEKGHAEFKPARPFSELS